MTSYNSPDFKNPIAPVPQAEISAELKDRQLREQATLAVQSGLNEVFIRFKDSVRALDDNGQVLELSMPFKKGEADLTYTRREDETSGVRTTDIVFSAKNAWGNTYQLVEQPDGGARLFECKKGEDGKLIQRTKITEPESSFDHNSDGNIGFWGEVHARNLANPDLAPRRVRAAKGLSGILKKVFGR